MEEMGTPEQSQWWTGDPDEGWRPANLNRPRTGTWRGMGLLTSEPGIEEARLKLKGDLAGTWVPELEEFW